MLITNCKFYPPVEESDLSIVEVTFDGMVSCLATIYREQNIRLKRSQYVVKWSDEAYIKSPYLEKCIDAEILDWYFDWLDSNSSKTKFVEQNL